MTVELMTFEPTGDGGLLLAWDELVGYHGPGITITKQCRITLTPAQVAALRVTLNAMLPATTTEPEHSLQRPIDSPPP